MSFKTNVLKYTAVFTLLLSTLAAMAPSVSAQVLVVDMQRIENESAAYKDFRLQTAEFVGTMNALGNALAAGGGIEQQAAEIGKQKQIIGPQKFEEEMLKLRRLQAQYERELRIYNVYYQRMQNELLTQVERVRTPILKDILAKRKAQVILPKNYILASATGLDVTTEVIEALDAALTTVTVTLPQRTEPEAAADDAAAGETSISELPVE